MPDTSTIYLVDKRRRMLAEERGVLDFVLDATARAVVFTTARGQVVHWTWPAAHSLIIVTTPGEPAVCDDPADSPDQRSLRRASAL